MAPLIWLMSMVLHLTSGVNLQQDHGAAETCQAIENQLFWALESCPAFNGLEQQTVPVCDVTEDVPAEAVQEAAHPPAAADGEPGEPEPAPEDRHNFALAADGAKLVAANKEAKKAAAILQVDDTFCLTPVKADNWMIIELSQVAKVDTVEMSQDELYSSRVKDFELRGRQTHPRSEGTDYTRGLNSTQWKLLGQFRAAKMKGTQSFAVEPTWVKYLQLRLLSHWGMESVCAINDLRVNGKSAAEDLEDRLSIDAPSEEEQDVPSPASAAELASGETAAPVNHAAEQSKPDVGSSQAAAAADGGAAGPAAAQNKTVSPPNSTGADEGSVAGAEQAEPKPVMLHPGADQSPVLVGESQQQPAPAAAAGVAIPAKDPAGSAAELVPPAPAELSGSSAPIATAEVAAGLPAVTLPKLDAADELLAGNSASSTKQRHGGSVYDLLVQELKALKLQHKALPRQLAELQRNSSMLVVLSEQQAAAIVQLQRQVAALQSAQDQLRPGALLLEPGSHSDTIVARSGEITVDMIELAQEVASLKRQVQHLQTRHVLSAAVLLLLACPALFCIYRTRMT